MSDFQFKFQNFTKICPKGPLDKGALSQVSLGCVQLQGPDSEIIPYFFLEILWNHTLF